MRADRNAPDGLAPLRGHTFDAVVGTATLSLPWVERALRDVRAGHWTFISSISVYADTYTRGQTARTARLRLALPDVGPYDPVRDPEPSQAVYGGVKLACEQAVREATSDTALVVRPGLIVGPGDDVGPFGYWPLRMARGRATAVPAANDACALAGRHVVLRGRAADQAGRRDGRSGAAGPPRPRRGHASGGGPDTCGRGVAAASRGGLTVTEITPKAACATGVGLHDAIQGWHTSGHLR